MRTGQEIASLRRMSRLGVLVQYLLSLNSETDKVRTIATEGQWQFSGAHPGQGGNVLDHAPGLTHR